MVLTCGFVATSITTEGDVDVQLRQALCTEAALNAVQRRYPQIYKSNDRLLLKPETIEVELRDFMISVKSLLLFPMHLRRSY